jgi:YHS domain-containing protein
MTQHDERRDSGRPGGGAGRRESIEPTGVWPASGPLPVGPAPTIGQADFGQGMRGAVGATESGRSKLVVYQIDPVCGANVALEHAAEHLDYRGHTYYFDSIDCRQRFEGSPERYGVQPVRWAG